jgi:hypothetical protein
MNDENIKDDCWNNETAKLGVRGLKNELEKDYEYQLD